MSRERLQKILARAGVASRREAEEIIAAGRVTVNGQVAGLGDKADPADDAVKVDGKRVHPPTGHRYLLLNKPRAVMSTRRDPGGRPTVLDLVPEPLRKALVPVGRLDFLTEGLLLLTDDGDLAQRVAHPRYGCTKTYEVKVRGMPAERDLERLRRGIRLEGRPTAPAGITARPVPGESDNSWWTVELSEGRTRQIRDMFQRIGHPVMKLRRVAIGPLRDADLPLGAVRELSEREVEQLRRSTQRGGGLLPRGGGRGSAPAAAPAPGPRRKSGQGGGPRAGGGESRGRRTDSERGAGPGDDRKRRGGAGAGAPAGGRERRGGKAPRGGEGPARGGKGPRGGPGGAGRGGKGRGGTGRPGGGGKGRGGGRGPRGGGRGGRS